MCHTCIINIYYALLYIIFFWQMGLFEHFQWVQPYIWCVLWSEDWPDSSYNWRIRSHIIPLRFLFSENRIFAIFHCCSNRYVIQNTYIILPKREGRTGRIFALGLDTTNRAHRGPYRKYRAPILFQHGPKQAWLMIFSGYTILDN